MQLIVDENGKCSGKKLNIEICSEAVNQDNYSVTSVGVVLCYRISFRCSLLYSSVGVSGKILLINPLTAKI